MNKKDLIEVLDNQYSSKEKILECTEYCTRNASKLNFKKCYLFSRLKKDGYTHTTFKTLLAGILDHENSDEEVYQSLFSGLVKYYNSIYKRSSFDGLVIRLINDHYLYYIPYMYLENIKIMKYMLNTFPAIFESNKKFKHFEQKRSKVTLEFLSQTWENT